MGSDRFEAALEKALSRVKSTVGTQNEKLTHSVLKNYYAPFSDEQEIKIGNFYADAVNENGIWEIQTKQLYKLRGKLSIFLESARVNLVHPLVCESSTVFINGDTGEIVKSEKPRKTNSWVKVFEEIYSIKDFLKNEKLKIIIVKIKVSKNVVFHGEKVPDLRSRAARRKCTIKKIPTEIVEEIVFDNAESYRILLPENLPKSFTKKELCAAAGESKSSLRLEILRETGIIEKTGKLGNAFVYSLAGR